MRNILLLLSVIVLAGCQKNDLKAAFDCDTTMADSNLKEYRDALKKYRIKLPNSWKTELYYDEFQSELFSADTTKGLTKTYILDISWHQGELNLDESFDQKVKDTLAIKEQLSSVKSSFGKFKKKPAYWNLSKGNSSGHPYQFLQMYVKTEVDEYFTFSTKVYGAENTNERLCESIAFFDKLQFIE